MQHNDIIAKCDAFRDRLKKRAPDQDNALNLTNEIYEALKFHFDTEESLLEMIGFPRTVEHKAKHLELIRTLTGNNSGNNDDIIRIVDELKNAVFERASEYSPS